MVVFFFCFTCEQIDALGLETELELAEPTSLLVELHYLPCLDYLSGMLRFGDVWLEAHEQYQKQSYRNRCYVRTANKVDALTVPVQHGTRHQPIRDLRIASDQPWAMHHWRCLRAAYGKAPFFEYYAPEFETIYRRSWTFLFDLSHELLTLCLNLLRVSPAVNLTKWYVKPGDATGFDARSQINPPYGPKSYLFHDSVPYSQNFGQEFVPNLSVIDLLFCQGPAASDVLRAGLRGSEQILKTLR